MASIDWSSALCPLATRESGCFGGSIISAGLIDPMRCVGGGLFVGDAWVGAICAFEDAGESVSD